MALLLLYDPTYKIYSFFIGHERNIMFAPIYIHRSVRKVQVRNKVIELVSILIAYGDLNDWKIYF